MAGTHQAAIQILRCLLDALVVRATLANAGFFVVVGQTRPGPLRARTARSYQRMWWNRSVARPSSEKHPDEQQNEGGHAQQPCNEILSHDGSPFDCVWRVEWLRPGRRPYL